MSFFSNTNKYKINGEIIVLKDLTVKEQEFINKNFEEMYNRKEFLTKLIMDIVVYNPEEVLKKVLTNEEYKIDVFKCIRKSSLNQDPDYAIGVAIEIINEESKNCTFRAKKLLIEIGYKYFEISKLSQKEIIEAVIYEYSFKGHEALQQAINFLRDITVEEKPQQLPKGAKSGIEGLKSMGG